MLSVSLPFKELVEGNGLGSEEFISELASLGVKSIELRAVRGSEDPAAVLTAAERVWRQNVRVSVHTGPRSAETAVEDIFRPLSGLLQAGKQEETVLVLHPVNGADLLSDNVRMMQSLTAYARNNALSVKFALENNRKMPDKSEGDSVELVKNVIREIDPEYAGLTFDFGHYAWYSKVWEKEIPTLPPKEFTERAIHTHIHALGGAETDYTTHFPLNVGSLPLREYLAALSPDYPGVFNIELEPHRFADICTGREGILGSLEVLKKYTL